MTAKTHKEKIQKALLILRPLPASLGKRRQNGMRPVDADAATANLNATIKLLEDTLVLYEDAERRYELIKGNYSRKHPREK